MNMPDPQAIAATWMTQLTDPNAWQGWMAMPPAGAVAPAAANPLAGVLKAAVPKGLDFTYPAGTFASARSIGKLGQALETAFVGAYLGAVTALKSNDLKGVAASIGANESRHLAILSNITAGTIVSGPSFPKALTAPQAKVALTPFLKM